MLVVVVCCRLCPHQTLFPKTNSLTSEHGCYQVRLCLAGQWTAITLDDYFPCFPVTNGGPVFSQSHGNELWVLLLEKAFAKVRGGYANLRFGYSLDALVDLTGAPFLHFSLGEGGEGVDTDGLWGQIAAWDKWGYVMSGSTGGRDVDSEQVMMLRRSSSAGGQAGAGEAGAGEVGLVLGHAYTVLQAQQTTSGERLLKLRNPW